MFTVGPDKCEEIKCVFWLNRQEGALKLENEELKSKMSGD
jgi:hypothetical protein